MQCQHIIYCFGMAYQTIPNNAAQQTEAWAQQMRPYHRCFHCRHKLLWVRRNPAHCHCCFRCYCQLQNCRCHSHCCRWGSGCHCGCRCLRLRCLPHSCFHLSSQCCCSHCHCRSARCSAATASFAALPRYAGSLQAVWHPNLQSPLGSDARNVREIRYLTFFPYEYTSKTAIDVSFASLRTNCCAANLNMLFHVLASSFDAGRCILGC